VGADTTSALTDWGVPKETVEALLDSGALVQV